MGRSEQYAETLSKMIQCETISACGQEDDQASGRRRGMGNQDR